MSDATLSSRDLPERLPVFPLPGVILLPGGRLPLNIFEPRYLDMVRDALGAHRLIGMIQPADPADTGPAPALYGIGGAGRITAFEETTDGRYLITLTGVSRFGIVEELPLPTRYRQVTPNWSAFADDLAGGAQAADLDRTGLLSALKAYLSTHDIAADEDAIAKAPSGALVNAMAMLCPFATSEKQALLEAPDMAERSRILVTLMEMATRERTGGLADDARRH